METTELGGGSYPTPDEIEIIDEEPYQDYGSYIDEIVDEIRIGRNNEI